MNQPDPETLYEALIAQPEYLRGLRRLTYRCATKNRCLLLDAVATADAILLHQKRFKQSDAVNRRRSTEAGRLNNTFDGENHWKPRWFFVGDSALAWQDIAAAGQSLQCDHVGVRADGGEVMLSAFDFEQDWEAGHSEVLVSRDGTRYVVP